MIPYGRQDISDSDIDSVVEVLKSEYLTQGPTVQIFEKSIAKYTGAKYAIAMNSATSALHLACLALGVTKGDIVWTSPISFVASANCALYCGALVDFVDIDPNTYNLSIECLENKLEEAKKLGVLPKVIIPVHLAGHSCNMEKIFSLSKKYGFNIIEDASHAIGGKYKNKNIGSCQYSDITVFSFHPVKIITTGEGGMALTNSQTIAKKINLLRSHGITRNHDEMTHEPDGDWYYQQIDLGYNYRMTDIQAALGISQLKRLDGFISLRHEIAERYNTMLKNLPVITPTYEEDVYSAYHLYIIRIKYDEIGCDQRAVFTLLREKDIGVNLHYIPIYRQPYYKQFGYKYNDFPESNKYYSEALTIPLYPGLKQVEQLRVVENLRECLERL